MNQWPYERGDPVDLLVHVRYRRGGLIEQRWVAAVVAGQGRNHIFVRRLDNGHMQSVFYDALRVLRPRSAIDRLCDLLG